MRKIGRVVALAAIVATSILAGLLIGGLTNIAFSEPPVRVLEMREAHGGVIEAGGRLQIVVRAEFGGARPILVDREIWRWTVMDGQRVQEHVLLPSGSAAIVERGIQKFVVSIPVPQDAAPGQWFYRSMAYYGCPLAGPLLICWKASSADIPLTIVPRRSTP